MAAARSPDWRGRLGRARADLSGQAVLRKSRSQGMGVDVCPLEGSLASVRPVFCPRGTVQAGCRPKQPPGIRARDNGSCGGRDGRQEAGADVDRRSPDPAGWPGWAHWRGRQGQLGFRSAPSFLRGRQRPCAGTTLYSLRNPNPRARPGMERCSRDTGEWMDEGLLSSCTGRLKTTPPMATAKNRQQVPSGAKPGPGLLASVRRPLASGKHRVPGPGPGLCRVPSSWLTRCLLTPCLPVSVCLVSDLSRRKCPVLSDVISWMASQGASRRTPALLLAIQVTVGKVPAPSLSVVVDMG